jgi:plastocyanin
MKRLISSVAAVAVLAAVAALTLAAPATTATTNVAITHSGFVPKAVTIQQGDSVTWTNSDSSNHQVTSQSAAFASPVLKPGDTFTFVFTKAGKFSYSDAYDKSFSGSVTVQAPAGSVTLNNSAGLVTFGSQVDMTGAVSNNQSGESVSIMEQQCGKSAAAAEKAATATTAAGGSYSVMVQPTMSTDYVAKWKSSTSTAVSVSVRPRIHLGRVSLRRFSVHVFAGSSLAGQTVTVQRWRPLLHRWTVARYAHLFANSSGVAPTVVSSVTFTLRVPHHVRLRVNMGQLQVTSCYRPNHSNAIVT